MRVRFSVWMRLAVVVSVLVACGALLTVYLQQHGEVVIDIEEGTLFGSLLKGDEDVLVILASGSGPTDRDGNSPLLKGRNDSMKGLAYGLNDLGYDVFRFDQRSSGKTFEMSEIEGVTMETFVGDMVAVIRHFKGLGYSRIVLIGHSQGALVATLAAHQEPVDGVVSLTGASEPIDRILLSQLKAMGTYSVETLDLVERLLNGLKSDNLVSNDLMALLNEGSVNQSAGGDGVLGALFSEANREFMHSWLQYDPYEVAKGLAVPQIFIVGTEDTQVLASSLTGWHELADESLGLGFTLEGMNHVLKRVPLGDTRANGASYVDPSYKLHEGLVPVIEGFVSRILAGVD